MAGVWEHYRGWVAGSVTVLAVAGCYDPGEPGPGMGGAGSGGSSVSGSGAGVDEAGQGGTPLGGAVTVARRAMTVERVEGVELAALAEAGAEGEAQAEIAPLTRAAQATA